MNKNETSSRQLVLLYKKDLALFTILALDSKYNAI